MNDINNATDDRKDIARGYPPQGEPKAVVEITMPEMIPDGETPRISGRSLYRLLGMEKDYYSWFRHLVTRCRYCEGTDFRTQNGHSGSIDHLISLRMAREICRLTRGDRNLVLLHFLDRAEEEWYTPDRLTRIALRKREEHEKIMLERLALLEQEQRSIPKELAVSIPGSFLVHLGKDK